MGNELRARARELRKNMTEAEKKLWYFLRDKQFCGKKFRRQGIIGEYIVDFVCYQENLIIEVDGGQHLEQKEYDQDRSNWLKGEGFSVLRFWNDQVLEDVEKVLEVIRREIEDK